MEMSQSTSVASIRRTERASHAPPRKIKLHDGTILIELKHDHGSHVQTGERKYRAATKESDKAIADLLSLKVNSRLIRGQMVQSGMFEEEAVTTVAGRLAANQYIHR